MFSGIIEELGQVERISRRGNVTLFELKADKTAQGTKAGDSISVNGACLTVVKNERNILSFEVIPETLKVANLKDLRIAEKANLERALKIGDRVSGHFVSGHVDCVGIIRRKSHISAALSFEIAVPAEFNKYILPKGSIAVDGISLTIADKLPVGFCVCIIPHTLKNTTLGFKETSDKVNIEFDLLAKKSAI